jgi:type IV secretion system protein VirB2
MNSSIGYIPLDFWFAPWPVSVATVRFFNEVLFKVIFMKTQTKDLSTAWQICLMVMLTAIVISTPDLAFAANNIDTPMGAVLCTVVGWFTGNTGKGLATIAITVIGIGALLGKVSWGMAIIVGIGVAIVFGAAGIIDAMFSGVTAAPGTSNPASGCSQLTVPAR